MESKNSRASKIIYRLKDWNLYSSKTSYDGKAYFEVGEYKCNLFIYDV